MVVKPLLIIAVAALHFAVMPRCPWPNEFVMDVQLHAQQIKGMDPFCFGSVSELGTIICLDCLRSIAKIEDGPLHKVHSGITALLPVGADEPLPGGLLDHGVLIEPFSIRSDIAGRGDIFHIHLPLDPQFGGGIIVSLVFGFLLRGHHFLSIPQPDKHSVK